MDMKSALRARLIADAAVMAAVGTYTPQGGTPTPKIFWVNRPQDSTLPAITLTTSGGEREQHLKGFQGLRSTRVRIDAWAATFAASSIIIEAAIAALVSAGTFSGVRFGRAFVGEPLDLGDNASGTFIHRKMVELTVFHTTEG